MRTIKYHIFVCALTLSLLTCASRAGAQNRASDKPSTPVAVATSASNVLTASARTAIVDKVVAVLDEYYVYPELGAKISAHLKDRLNAGKYDAITSEQQLAGLLTQDMQAISHDRHLGMMYNPGGVAPGEAEMTPEEHARQNEEMKRFGDAQNWGFVRAEVLPGNIGYLDLRFFGHPDWAGESAATAMAFLARTDALIIDVRTNYGGYPQTVALLLSYLLERDSIHGGTEEIPLFLQNDRKSGTVTTVSTLPYVPGKKYLQKDVYLLTSHRSFSGSELFAQALKTNKRAMLIGETTAGASHSMLERPISEHLAMSVSFGWTKDATTGYDWEGIGVTPDVPVPPQTALEKARLLALKKRLASAPPPEQGQLQGLVAEAERALADAQPKGPLEGNTSFHLKGHTDARAVTLAGDFNRFDPKATPMVRDGDGWTVKIDLKPGKYFYKFVVDEQWLLDPANPNKGLDPTGWDSSLRTVAK